jgi:hypothetical protein
MNDIKITKREIAFSVVIVSAMLIFGFFIAEKIEESIQDKSAVYNTAIQIDNNTEMFAHCINTGIKNLFVYGDIYAVDPIAGHGIEGEYAYVHKQKQVYTKHERTVREKRGDKWVEKTEYYWTWDNSGSEEWHCNKISLLNIEFPYNTIKLPVSTDVETIYESRKVRYQYSVSYSQYTGTTYIELNDQSTYDGIFFNEKTIQGAIDNLESNFWLIFFWIIWIILTGIITFGFMYLDNRWLEDN